MSIDNKKLLKELSAIYASSNKAKTAVVAEIAKVDEKYRKLAEDEKKELSATLAQLEQQLDYYGKILGLGKNEESVEEEEAPITDTIFPENNMEKAVDEFIVEGDHSVIEKAVEDIPEVAEAPAEPVNEEPVQSEDAQAWLGDVPVTDEEIFAEPVAEEEKKEDATEDESFDNWELPQEWK